MKKLLLAAAILCATASLSLSAEDLGLEASVEFATGDFLSGDAFSLEVTPALAWTAGESGFSMGLSWTAPLVPSFDVGSLELSEEYAFSLSDFEFAIGNANTLYLNDPISIDGTASLSAAWNILSLGFDIGYYPDFLLDSWVAADYALEAGPGELGTGICLNFPLLPTPGLGDIEAYVSYSLPIGPVALLGELDATVYGLGDNSPGFGLSALLALSYAF